MPSSKVTAYFRDGSPCSNARVVLGFSGGNSCEAFTNSRGEAIVEHASSGTATVYVRGKSYGTFRAPGSTVVTVSS